MTYEPEHEHDARDDSPDDQAMEAALIEAGRRARRSAGVPDGAAAAAIDGGRRIRRAHRLTAAAALVALASVGGSLAWVRSHERPVVEVAAGADPSGVRAILANLPDRPVDPATVRLTAAVSRFDSCPALLDRVRRVGAEHVGSRGFGEVGFLPVAGVSRNQGTLAADESYQTTALASAGGAGGETLGTNVQVVGVDEPDEVKASGALVVAVRGDRLRVVDTAAGAVLSSTDLDPDAELAAEAAGAGGTTWSELLLAGKHAVVFGSAYETSDPVPGDPSATTSSRQFVTVATYDLADPAHPVEVDRVRIDGHLVSARLVGDEVRMVTGWSMGDIGFVLPTSPESVPIALAQNRRSVAGSSIDDWIPAWERDGRSTPLVDCADVVVPDTFAGVSMTTMVSFSATRSFEPRAMGLLAPTDLIYATAERVAVAAGVWVDPAQRVAERFDRWDTAIHTFDVSGDRPAYVASGQVPGSLVSQFAFGEVGDALGVVAAQGAPWASEPAATVDLHVLRASGARLEEVGALTDLAGGSGGVSTVRFTHTRAYVATGPGDRLRIVDLTDPTAPRAAGSVTLPGWAGYVHPVTDERVLVVASVPSGSEAFGTSASLIDATEPDAPAVRSTWSQVRATTPAVGDHHAFSWWPQQGLAAFPLARAARNGVVEFPPPVAVLLAVGNAAVEPAAVVQPRDVDVVPPCRRVEPALIQRFVEPSARFDPGALAVLDCDSARPPDWPGWSCQSIPTDQRVVWGRASRVDLGITGTATQCNSTGWPQVERVLVVDGAPWIYTSESLERLEPDSWAPGTLIPVS